MKFTASCYRFLAALIVLTICYAAQHSPAAASPWLGFSAWHRRCHNSLLYREEEVGTKLCRHTGSPRIDDIRKSAGVRDKTWP